MANIADLGAMMLAATHHLRTLEPHTTEEIKDLTAQLRSGADALRRASTAWKSVSTLQPQSHEFGAASLELFNVMREVITAPTALERGSSTTLDVDQALHSLARGVDDLTHFMERAHGHPRLRPQPRPLRARPGPPQARVASSSANAAVTSQSSQRVHSPACPGVGGADTGVAPGDSAEWERLDSRHSQVSSRQTRGAPSAPLSC